MPKLPNIRFKNHNKLFAAGLAVAVVIIGYAIIASHASGFFAANEVETGTLSGNASLVTDGTASGGKAVQFNAPAGTGGGSGGGTGGGGTTGSSTCPLPKYPSNACVGVPAGTALTTHSGEYDVTTANTVISGVHVTGDMTIRATGVVIKNSQIDGTISNDGISNSSFSISDSEVGTGVCNPVGTPSLWGHDITATRVYLHGHQDAIDMGGSNVTVSDSLLQPCFLNVGGGDGFHTDSIQDLCSATCTNLTLTHNTLDSRVASGNSALNLGSTADGSHMQGVTLTNNLFMGGGYTTDLRFTGGAKWVVTGNAWVSGAYSYDPISTEGTCSNQTWSGNTLVTIAINYVVTSTVGAQACVN